MTRGHAVDLSACDREPIHIPGATQPHGAMVALDRQGRVCAASGRTLEFLGEEPEALLGRPMPPAFIDPAPGSTGGYVGTIRTVTGLELDLTKSQAGQLEILEFEPVEPGTLRGMASLMALEQTVALVDAAADEAAACDAAARGFRALTGYDRIMIYRFLEDEAGRVVGEARRPELSSFMHHHFPASDIPRQARALYLRNLIRVIPDARYTPSPIVARGIEPNALDLSDSVLRSVSPVHLQYLVNMGVGASASASIVVDGKLWGLAAMHHMTARAMPNDTRAVCRMLAGALARRIKHFTDVANHQATTRLSGVREHLMAELARRGDGFEGLADHLLEVMEAGAADGVALVLPDRVLSAGSTPPYAGLRPLARWAQLQAGDGVLALESLSNFYVPALDWTGPASGLMAIALEEADSPVVLWFRAEHVETVRWAGDPHKAMEVRPGEQLTPRASFEEWKQTVRGRARRWTEVEVEAARRLREDVAGLNASRSLKRTNEELSATVALREQEIAQRDFMLKEVNHRIQNNLQLVASFLSLQRRETEDPQVREHLDEALRRMRAVGLVHRRLYRSEMVEAVEMDRYLDELIGELKTSLGPEWEDCLQLEVETVSIPTDRAVAIGLVLTELVINVAKYAYGGSPGPVRVSFGASEREVALTVADQGKGRPIVVPSEGFGTRMMKALVAQLGGSLTYADNNPGARAVLTAPVI